MRFIFNIAFCIPLLGWAQDYAVYTETIRNFYTLPQETDTRWQKLVAENKIPLVIEDSVAFLYRGDAKSISWMGDFNGWGYDKTYPNKGTQIPNTNIWILKASFPKNARIDYKILINEKDWILDPANPNHQWSGVGGGSPNSELRMPDWQPDPITVHRENIPRGRLNKDALFDSKIMGYQVTYSTYLPHNYSTDKTYPILYVTDGYEYLHERMGNMTVILDNLLADNKIEPICVVFIDHREPANRSNNRRMTELSMSNKYLNFITLEFIPFMESNLSVCKEPAQRGILGTSMGGLTAAYFAFSKPEIFGLAGIQSPAFWFKPEIYTFCDQAENPPVKIYLTTGTIHDAKEGALKMKSILEKNTCTYQYIETNQGHSWGNFRNTIDDILVYFFPPR